ncbi:uncharacterized protein Tco025E_02564 [Trypanosoma conorhini]|uniref:Transmembrane protein n=1 Tax=Trypanosoma conorhini TaxID=83891 RepID=A0A422Q2X4_9TRYP|nr:uncharacterized protein Tco025E_02564 [Trypanosoma conorhini]RNF24313.1 hypothetical protein Tco025E_02564 [Trypanosoma conorhini]
MPLTEVPVFFTDAGPPPSLTFLTAWTLLLGASFVVFGVARPAVRGTRAPTAGEKEAALLPLWWVQQLHLSVASWALFDLVHRILSYIFLPSRVLWRRHMLPLPDGSFGACVNQLRLSFLCVGQVGDAHRTCADWQLPTTSFASSTAPRGTTGAPGAAQRGIEEGGSVSNTEWEYCQGVALASLLASMLMLLLACRTIFRLIPLRPSETSMHEDDCSEEDTTSDEELSSASEEDLWWGLGDPDDACLLSPEAIVAEQRWKSMEAGKRHSQQSQREREREKERSAIRILLREYWPPLLSVCYAGLYAFTGGISLLLRRVYPVCVILVALCGMIA